MFRILWISLALFVIFVQQPVRAEAPYDDKEVLRIGFIGPLTGPASSYGIASRNGIDLALSEFGAGSGLKFIFENDEGDPKKTVTAFKKLTEIDKAQIVITLASTPSNAVAPLAELQGIPLLAWASDPKVSKGKRFVLRTYPSSEAEGARIAEEASRREYENVAIFTSVNDYASTLKMGFKRVYPKERIVHQEELPADTNDFRPTLLKAKAKNARSFFICLNPGQSGLFAKQASQLKLTAHIFGCDFLDNSEELKISNGALKDAWYVTIDVTEKFQKLYKEKFKNQDFISASAIQYDLVHVLHRITPFDGNSRDLADRIFSAGDVMDGGLLRAKFRSTGNNRFLDTALVVKTVGSTNNKDSAAPKKPV